MKTLTEYVNESNRFDESIRKNIAATEAFLLLMCGEDLKDVLSNLNDMIKEKTLDIYERDKKFYKDIDQSLLDCLKS